MLGEQSVIRTARNAAGMQILICLPVSSDCSADATNVNQSSIEYGPHVPADMRKPLDEQQQNDCLWKPDVSASKDLAPKTAKITGDAVKKLVTDFFLCL
jgi:hypothetical protein